MESYSILKDLAIIIIAAKLFGILARKCKAPQVVGEIIAGLLIGPSILGLVDQSDFILQMAEIGVILLMFSAGLETDLKELMKTGPIAALIACAGVFIPLVLGALYYMVFYGFAPWGSNEFYEAVFIGTILTATSVSITVQSLKEMGKLKGRVGTTILSAAIIDDVIGIIVLTFVIGFKNPDSKPSTVVINTILFFVLAVGVGFISYKIFKWIDKRYPHTRRIPIAGLAYCFIMSYVAEQYFGIADITGAYVAGIILCSINDSEYIERKIDINSYMLFGPVFFASIGLKTDLNDVTGGILLFAVGFVIVGLISKIIGCGLMARICRFKGKDALKIGVGMMTRGEVALIVAQKGLSMNLIDPVYFTAVILLIIVSSISTPIVLKFLYSRDKEENGVQTA
ncbi:MULTISPECIES: cation:proton antiporter [Suilimivivens]|jgi:sodium/hydrogen exchanger family protein|uniref:Cation:proton antiporter n=1 Tax=Suilimivivens aceti TaxID=2981774 RepID=A0ABT2T251_9FIRM|nr:cation:proton antiporter [Suilimivivens aceti]MCU6744346.1 cation:proton antiporter [Suilimivivens aceti]SCH67854.1 K(+)/H(+) antiporter [uncultured Clostridium sp.]